MGANSGGGNEVLSTYVTVGADLSPFDQAMAQLPTRVSSKITEASNKIRAQMARERLKIKELTSIANNQSEDAVVRGAAAAQVQKHQAALAALRVELERAQAPATKLVAANEKLAAANLRAAASGSKMSLSAWTAAEAQARLATATTRVTTAQAGVSGSTRNNAMAFLMLSQAVEDAQYGFNGIVNNIPGIVMAMGGSGGLAGAVSLAAIGVNQLIKHWDEVAKIWRSDETNKEVERMKRLAEWTKKVAEQTKKLREEKGEVVNEGKSSIEEAHQKVGHDQAVKDISEALTASGRGMGTYDENYFSEKSKTKEQKIHDAAMTGAGVAGIGGAGVAAGYTYLTAVDDPKAGKKGNIIDANKPVAEDLLSKATLGDKAAIDFLTDLMTRGGGNFTKGFGRNTALGNALSGTPYGQKSPDQIAKEHESRTQNMRGNAAAAEEKARQEKLEAAKEQKTKDADAIATKLDSEAADAAGNFKGRYGSQLLHGDEAGDNRYEIEAKIKADLEKAGESTERAAQLAQRIIEKLIGELEAKIQSRVQETGKDRFLAVKNEKAELAAEAKERVQAQMKKLGEDFKPSIMGVGDYINKLQTAGTRKKDETVAELKVQTPILKDIKKGISAISRVARPRAKYATGGPDPSVTDGPG